MSLDIIYYSNKSGNTKRFVQKLGYKDFYSISEIDYAERPYVLFVPTYGGGADSYAIPKQVSKFLNNVDNRSLLVGVVGFGNRNFGEHYCLAARQIALKTGVPIVGKVELFGTPEDVSYIYERLKELNDAIQLS